MSTNLENQPYVVPDSAGQLPATAFPWGGLVATLIIFLLILLVSLWFIRRLNRSALRGMNAPWARVLDRQLLGGQQVLYLVEVAGKLQILAGSDHYLTKLSEIEDPDLAAEILDEIANRPADRAGSLFAGIMYRWNRKGKNSQPFAKELARMLGEADEK